MNIYSKKFQRRLGYVVLGVSIALLVKNAIDLFKNEEEEER